MKSKLFLGGMFAFVAFVLINASSVHSAPAGTNVGGPIISDTTWTVAGSPYIVIANVDVLTGVTLTIQPGVVVKFNTGMILQVDGTLIAQGTSVNKITFTSNLPNPQPGDWGNIMFTDSSVDATYIGGNYISGSILHYCIVEYGGSTDTMTGAIETNSASPFIDHCIVRNNGTTGIHGGGTVSSPIVISNNTVIGNSTAHYGGAGIYAYFGTVTGNIVSANSDTGYSDEGGGIYADSSTVMSNTISGNSTSGWGGGMYALSSTVTGNKVSGNSTSSSGGGIYAESSTVTGNKVSDNSASSGGGIAASNSTVTGNTVSGNSASSSHDRIGGGGIYAYYSTVTGNTVSRNNSVSSGGGINVDSSTVISNTVINNKVPITSQGAGIYVANYAGAGDLLYNTVVGNSAISPTLAQFPG